jgi:hypothetical protein
MYNILPESVLCDLLPSEAADDLMSEYASCVTFFSWDAISEKMVRAHRAGLPSPLQTMDALVAQLQEELPYADRHYASAQAQATRFGCHIGQLVRGRLGTRVNPLVLYLLSELSGVPLYKCDFDRKSNCCRVFLKDAHSFYALTCWSKRLRCTSEGVLVADTEDSVAVVDSIRFHGHLPLHSMPIEAMRSSHETTLPPGYALPEEQQQQQQAFFPSAPGF